MSLEHVMNSRNSVTVHMYDSIYPLTEEESFPENLISIEIISQLHKRRKLINGIVPRFMRNMFGLGADDQFGERSGEGHYVVEIHLSKRFIDIYGIERFALEPQMFMRPGDPSIIFTAWSGDVNIASLLTRGMVGFTDPIREGNGFAGKFQSFGDVVKIGEAGYEAGWFMSNEQTFRMLDAIMKYPGIKEGYTFLSRIGDYPDHLFNPAGNRMGNGRNCGDFFWYLMDKSGVVPMGISDPLKIRLGYPACYFDKPIPLSPAGQKGVEWLAKNEGVSTIPEKIMARLVGWDMFCSQYGIEFFDKKKVVEKIRDDLPEFHAARIWDHANVIEWLRNPANRDFEGKGIITELLPEVRAGQPHYDPRRTVKENEKNRYILSPNRARLQEVGEEYRRHKLAKARLHDGAHLALREFEEKLYTDF